MSNMQMGVAPIVLDHTEDEAAPLSRLRRFIGTIFSPGKTFLDIGRRPDWVLPVVFSVIVVIGGDILINRIYQRNPQTVARNSVEKELAGQGKTFSELPEQQRQQAELQIKVLSNMLQLSPLLSGIYTLVAIFILARVYWLGALLIKGESSFKKIFAVTAYAYGAIFIGAQTIFQIIVAYLRHNNVVAKGVVVTNAAGFFSSDASPILVEFVTHFDLFTIWFLILMSIGLAAVCKRQRLSRTAPVVFTLWGVWIALRVVWIAALQ